MRARLEPVADLLDVLPQRVHRPIMHREHRPALRRTAARRLPLADVQRPVGAELRRLRVAMQIREIEHHRLAAAQPPRVDDLEQRRVAERRQRPLPAAARDAVDLVVGVVEEPLQLLARSTPAGPGRPSNSLTCTAVFHSWQITAGARPNRCSHSSTQPYRGSHTNATNNAERSVIPADRRMRQPRPTAATS